MRSFCFSLQTNALVKKSITISILISSCVCVCEWVFFHVLRITYFFFHTFFFFFLFTPLTKNLKKTQKKKVYRCVYIHSIKNMPSVIKYHVFQEKTFQGLVYCDYCGKMLWGIARQGVHCAGKQTRVLYSSK